MEIRMAYPNEINRIMEIIQDGKDSLAAAGVNQWQDGYPDQEIIFEDILESRGYVAVENQEVVAYAALHKGNEAAYNDIYDGKWEHDNYLYISFHRVAVAKEAAGRGVAQTFLQGLIEGEKGLFIAMPSRKASDGEYRDIAHPINSDTRDIIQKSILQEYEAIMASGEEETVGEAEVAL